MSELQRVGVKALSVVVFAGSVLLASNSLAMDTFMVGPRATGMAGANVASTNDMSAQYYNPAAFGFFGMKDEREDAESKRLDVDNNSLGRKDWGFDVHAGVGYRQHNEFGAFLDDISDIDIDQLNASGIQTKSDLEKVISLVKDLDGLDDPGNAISANMNGGFGVRIKNYGVGVLGYFQATGQVASLDTSNLGININGADIAADIVDPGVDLSDTSYVSAGYTFQVFDASQQTDLWDALGGDAAATEALQRLDYMAAEGGVTSSDVQTVSILLDVVNQAGTGSSLDNNTTTVLLSGFGLAEVPLTYGYAINKHFSVGANFKIMRGRVYGNQILVFDNDSGDAVEKSDDQYEETTTFGLDLGLMARFKKINLGLVGRNLNSPEFDGFTLGAATFEDVRIEPQVTFGVAHIPFDTLTIEADIDLTKNETTLPGYETQNVMLGLEWDMFSVLAIRLGAYKNLAESDIDWVYAGGLGIDLWALRVDLGVNYSSTTEQFDGDDIPKEIKGVVQLSLDF